MLVFIHRSFWLIDVVVFSKVLDFRLFVHGLQFSFLKFSIGHFFPLFCSAGVGRTGAFIVIDAMLESIKKKKVVDVFNYVQLLRNNRISMVQTEVNIFPCRVIALWRNDNGVILTVRDKYSSTILIK